ncbi:hypothetical protein PSTG_18236, partial [Puccinia striiformis f. sp. tritici PST-78]
DLAKLKLGSPRKKDLHLSQSQAWKDSIEPSNEEALATSNGVGWSPLNLLPCRDPIQRVALGVLHNWDEGVLQHHWCKRWGFQKAQPLL